MAKKQAKKFQAIGGGFLLTGFLLLAQQPKPPAKPTTLQPPASQAPGGYSFKVIARVENNQGDKLSGLTVGGLGLGKTISLSDTGHVLFYATSEKGCTAFLDRAPVFYIGMEVSGKTLLNCTKPVLSRKGDYAFFARYREKTPNGGTRDSFGIALNGQFVLTAQQKLSNGYTVSNIQSQSLRFDEMGRYVASVSADPPPNGGPSKRFRIVDGVPMEDAPPPPPEPLPKDAGSITASNNAHQSIYWSSGIGTPPRIKTAEGRVFPSASNNFAMNDLGQIFTADPMVMNYADATEQPPPLPSPEYYSRLIDLSPLALQGMSPFRMDHGKPVYGFGVIGDYGTVAINNIGQLAFYVFYARKPGQNFDGSAVVLATPANLRFCETQVASAADVALAQVCPPPSLLEEIEEAIARARTKKPSILYHYTGKSEAKEIKESGMMIASEVFSPVQKSGAYATNIVPAAPGWTQEKLSRLFYGDNPNHDMSWYVQIDNSDGDFRWLGYQGLKYLYEWLKDAPYGTMVPVKVLSADKNPMLPK